MIFDSAMGAVVGTLVGMRHALEADHVAAVATLVANERRTWRAAWLGAWWGLGHTLTLVLAGACLILLRAEMPLGLAAFFESIVAMMLIGLGVRAIDRAIKEGRRGPARIHHHGGLTHTHPAVASHLHVGAWTLARRPLLIGAIHGLAGSGALTALVFATLPSDGARVTYVLLFGLGSTLGMAMLSGLLGWPLARLGTRAEVTRAVTLLVGCVSTALGVILGYPLMGQLF